MSDFKLIAIRPLDGCDKRFSKNLSRGEIYKFYADYHFNLDGNAVMSIEHKPTVPKHLYDLSLKGRTDPLQINISAVVGKNGSGKSTLIELLFLAIYNLAASENILNYKTKDDKGVVITKSYEIEPSAMVEVYYLIHDKYFCLSINDHNKHSFVEIGHVNGKTQTGSENDQNVVEPTELKSQTKTISDIFFYTIAINYSFYGLDATYMGDWIEALFHKNDAYQTPVVINPMRTDGNIDVGKENNFVYQRLLANILEPVEDGVDLKETLLNLVNDKIVNGLILQLNSKKVEKYKKNKDLNSVANGEDCLGKLYNRYTEGNALVIPQDPEMQTTFFYALFKIQNICRVYKRYNGFIIDNAFDDIDGFIEAIINDQSHITFKLKQALNYLRYRHIPMDGTSKPFNLGVNKLSSDIAKIKKEALRKNRKLSTIELLPPPIFDISISLGDHGSFDFLSSGEKQKIYSITSVIYHLINLNSVFKNGEISGTIDQNKYRYVNIIFDEVELYFHPEFQRTYINDLLTSFQRINPVNIDEISGLNICMLTHSPFILSDIPVKNTLRMDKGKILPLPVGNTFGANIHDLLADDFFMEDGFMGALAKKKIGSAIDFLNKQIVALRKGQVATSSDWDEKTVKELIDTVGEPLIRNSLNDLYNVAFPFIDKDKIKKEIERLDKLLNP